jgi:hypothetical protein
MMPQNEREDCDGEEKNCEGSEQCGMRFNNGGGHCVASGPNCRVILFWVKQKRVLPPDYSRLVPVKSTAGDTQWAQRFKDGQNPAS